MSNAVAEKIAPELDIEQFERRRYENYLREKNFIDVEKIDDSTFYVSNPTKNVVYKVCKEQTEDGVIYASCSCRDYENRCILYSPIPGRCKHVFAALDWKRSMEKKLLEEKQQKNEIEEQEENQMSDRKFDPQKYLIQIKGKDYLPVNFRIHWFRQEHPQWRIQTEIVKLDLERGISIVKAEICNEKGNILAVGHKMELQKNFADFIEKCETGSIGRALASLGYGTLQSMDLDEGIEAGRIADAPVSLQSQNAAIPSGKYSSASRGGNGKSGNGKSTGGNGRNTGKIDVQRVIEKW